MRLRGRAGSALFIAALIAALLPGGVAAAPAVAVAAAPPPPAASAEDPAAVSIAPSNDLDGTHTARVDDPNPFSHLPGAKPSARTAEGPSLAVPVEETGAERELASIQRLIANAIPSGAPRPEAPYTISGKVTGTGGFGLSADVFAFVQDSTVTALSTTTASDGTYSLSVGGGGRVQILVTNAAGYAAGWWSSSGFAYDSGNGGVIDTTGGSVGGINVRLPALLHLSGRLDGAGIVGGLAGANVRVMRGDAVWTKTTTAADGTWSVVVQPGTYAVGAAGPAAYAPGWYATYGTQPASFEASPITVTSADVTGINLVLPLARHVSGKVVSPVNTPLSNVYVEAYAAAGYYSPTVGEYLGRVTTDAGGTFSIPVAPGVVTLWVWDLDGPYAGGHYISGTVTADYHAATRINVSTTDVTGVGIKLLKAGILTGHVATPSIKYDLLVEASVYGQVASVTFTDTAGNYRLLVPAGTYMLWTDSSTLGSPNADIYAGGYWSSSGMTFDPRAATPINVAEGASKTINLTQSATHTINGRLSDRWGWDSQPMTIHAWEDASSYLVASTEADSYGSYSVRVPVGVYRLSADDLYNRYASVFYREAGFSTTWSGASSVAAGSSDISGYNIHMPIMKAPSAPATPTAKAYNQSVVVSWTKPADGYSPITNYQATASPGGKTCVATADPLVKVIPLTCTITGLTNGTAYTFKVRAVSAVGWGAFSPSTAVAVTPRAVPNAPSNVTARRAASGKLLVSWTAPSGNGSAIAGYTAVAQPGGAVCAATAPATSCTIDSLTNGTWYTVSVVATSMVGPGPAGLAAPATPNPPILRASGADAYATAVAVSRLSFPPDCGCVAYIAYVGNFPDGLAAGASAGTLQGPVLFANTTGGLNSATVAELNRLHPRAIAALGGVGVLSDPTLYALDWYGVAFRLYGASRYETAVEISRNTYSGICACTVYIAYGGNFPDALSGGAAAGTVKGPLLLTATTGAINPATVAELKRLKPAKIVVLGGTGVISASVYSALASYAPSITRYGGADRYDTAARVSKGTFAASSAAKPYVAYVGSGTDFTGAIAGASAAGRIPGPLLLVSSGGVPSYTKTELTRIKPTQIIVIGNTSIIPAAVYTALVPYAPAN